MPVVATTASLTVLLSVATHHLSSPSFPRRERAHQLLTRALPASLPYLRAAQQDTEAVVRADIIVRHHWQASAKTRAAQILPEGYPVHPWISSLPSDYPERQRTIDLWILEARKKYSRGGPPHWTEYRLATQLWLEDQLADGAEESDLRRLLEEMKHEDLNWIAQYGHRYTPPVTAPK